jgi:predicted nuclease of predicted toxin-antitoxin system
MKLLLLFDQNLSYKLVRLLSDLYPGSTHVKLEALEKADDIQIWDFAQ